LATNQGVVGSIPASRTNYKGLLSGALTFWIIECLLDNRIRFYEAFLTPKEAIISGFLR